MKKILGAVRRADSDFRMIQPGDRICVGVSGGKDSLVLLKALAAYRAFAPNPFELTAVTLTLGISDADWRPVAQLCGELRVPYAVEKTQIGSIVLERREPNPCSLCARMRRGALVSWCRANGHNKLALGHHLDDAIETLFLSVLMEGRFHTFHPATALEGSGITQIRPLVYITEGQAASAARRFGLPVTKAACPVDGDTERTRMKELVAALRRRYPDAREKLLSALMNDGQYGLWEKR